MYKPSLDILSVKHGVTELELSNGKLMRLTVHVDGVSWDSADKVQVSYEVIVEMIDKLDSQISDIHETIQ